MKKIITNTFRCSFHVYLWLYKYLQTFFAFYSNKKVKILIPKIVIFLIKSEHPNFSTTIKFFSHLLYFDERKKCQRTYFIDI